MWEGIGQIYEKGDLVEISTNLDIPISIEKYFSHPK